MERLPSQLLYAAEQGAIELFSSAALVDELRNVLSRPKCAKRLLQADFSVDLVLSMYSSAVSLVEPLAVLRLAPDPDDDVVIGTAFAAKADLLVTGDRALLSVAKYEGVRIVSVREALDAIVQGVSQDAP